MGTGLVADLEPGAGDFNPASLIPVGSRLAFTRGNSTELWSSEGTVVGTIQLLTGTIRDSGADSLLVPFGDKLLMRAWSAEQDPSAGREPWVTDGTVAGTIMLKDIRSGAASSDPYEMTAGDGGIFFHAESGSTADQLWWTDGTPQGTVAVADIAPLDESRRHYPAYALGRLYLAAASSNEGWEPWTADSGGAAILRDIEQNVVPTYSSYPDQLTDVDDRLFFSATDGLLGGELWSTEGTEPTTSMISDIYPGSSWSWPSDFVALGNGFLLFTANQPDLGRELWISDGLETGTSNVEDIHPGSSGSDLSAPWLEWDSLLFFAANDGISGSEPWRSNGSGSYNGTRSIADIAPGANGSHPHGFVKLGAFLPSARIYFAADANWNSPTPPATPRGELWKTDGGAETVQVADIWPGPLDTSDPDDLVVFNDELFFSANDGSSGRELWKLFQQVVGDPATDTVVRVKDIMPGAEGSDPRDLIVLDSRAGGSFLFFTADDGSGRELWTSDGTSAGTLRVADIRPGSEGSDPQHLIESNRILLFTADDGSHGRELWLSDGTTSGTTLIMDIRPGVEGAHPHSLAVDDVSGRILFVANDGTLGFEPWETDGTPAGTSLVQDILPGAGGSCGDFTPSFPGFSTLVPSGDRIYFRARHPHTGYELWALPRYAPGAVPASDDLGGPPLTIDKVGGDLRLSWATSSCAAGTEDYAIYEGQLGDFGGHAIKQCSTLGLSDATISPGAEDHYFIVVPRNITQEGSYGRDSNGSERLPATDPCGLQVLGDACSN